MQVRELQPRLDGHATRAETYVPQDTLLLQFQGLHSQQANRRLGYHLFPAIKQCKFVIGNAEVFRSRIITDEYQAVGIVKFTHCGFFKGQG